MSALMPLPFLAGIAWVARAWCTADQSTWQLRVLFGIQLQGCSPCGQDSTVVGGGVSMLSALGSASCPTSSLCVVGKRWE